MIAEYRFYSLLSKTRKHRFGSKLSCYIVKQWNQCKWYTSMYIYLRLHLCWKKSRWDLRKVRADLNIKNRVLKATTLNLRDTWTDSASSNLTSKSICRQIFNFREKAVWRAWHRSFGFLDTAYRPYAYDVAKSLSRSAPAQRTQDRHVRTTHFCDPVVHHILYNGGYQTGDNVSV